MYDYDFPKKEEKVGIGKFEDYEDDLFKAKLSIYANTTFIDKAWLVCNPIPVPIYQQAMAFFDYCHKTLKAEGMLLLRYNDGEWSLAACRQYVGMGHVDAHPEINAEQLTNVVGDIHSHPGMGAFHSGTDEADERKIKHGLFMVASSFESMKFSPFSSVINVLGYIRGKSFEIDPVDIFDMNGKLDPNVTFPEEWKALVSTEHCPHCPKEFKFGKHHNRNRNRNGGGGKHWWNNWNKKSSHLWGDTYD